MSDKIRAFKGFRRNMTCRDFQYEEGKEYEHKGEVKACASGFHACENPIDCFRYYDPGTSVFHEVELDGQISRDSDASKVAASHIRIGARLDVAGICKATFDYVRSRCTNEHNADPGKPATAGEYGAATAGYAGAATAGDRGAATAGDRGAATAGDAGAATSRGSSSSGANGLSVARGENVKVRGGMGAVLVIAIENSYDYDIKEWKAAVVDGEHIKPDTWYKLEDGKFVEVEA